MEKMNGDVVRLFENIGSTFLLAVAGWLFRRIRNYFRALRYAQEDLSTIWIHLGLPRKLRSGSYAFPKRGEPIEDDE